MELLIYVKVGKRPWVLYERVTDWQTAENITRSWYARGWRVRIEAQRAVTLANHKEQET